jgi:hypothetical protein
MKPGPCLGQEPSAFLYREAQSKIRSRYQPARAPPKSLEFKARPQALTKNLYAISSAHPDHFLRGSQKGHGRHLPNPDLRQSPDAPVEYEV